MKEEKEFYIGYVDTTPPSTKKFIKKIIISIILFFIVAAAVFSLSQKPFINSTFELSSETKITGIYHESPYPMLRVKIGEGSYKNIILMGYGKFGANMYTDAVREKLGSSPLNKQMTIEGNLTYYNGKTLLQVTDEEKITVDPNISSEGLKGTSLGAFELEGEVVDPKCYFGVMKPGKGKIHRSCAVRCIAGGMPPVLVTTDDNNTSEYFLLTDMKGKPIHDDILPYIGQPSRLKGAVEKLEDWYVMKIDVSDIKKLDKESTIY